jgi:hypothetical protein
MDSQLKELKHDEIVDVKFFASGVAKPFVKTLRFLGGNDFYDPDMFDSFGGVRTLDNSQIVQVWRSQ